MKKVILILTFVWLAFNGYAQQQPLPESEEYQQLKEDGKLTPEPEGVKERPKNYPVLKDAREAKLDNKEQKGQKQKAPKQSQELSMYSSLAVEASAYHIENPENDPSYTVLLANDDGSSPLINLDFSFNFFGDSYNKVYVNNNGNISFGTSYSSYSSTGFPSTHTMIAPFWADVDTRGTGSGVVYYKAEANRLTVIWYQVGYYARKVDKRNTFQLIISDGSDPSIGIGNNLAFYYGDMEWTTGSASGGTNGFGGVPATVGVNKGSGENNCFYSQVGRFGKDGFEHINAFDTSGVKYLTDTSFFFDASKVEGVSVDLSYTNHFCAVNFTPEIINPQNCKIESYLWDFGDGSTSNDSDPVHAFGEAGTFEVKLDVSYACGTCSNNTVSATKQVQVKAEEEMFTDLLLEVKTDLREQVLEVSSTTFSNAWPIQHNNPVLNEQNSFLNGSQGVWRNEGTHVYQVPRQASSSVNVSEDGTFTLENFNWGQAELNAIPNWIKANSMTQYSPYSYELENQNVLGTYSAALYDYGGQLPTANGVNMRNDEMAFTSFEYQGGPSTGNWIFGTASIPEYKILKVLAGNSNMAVVEAPLEAFEFVEAVDVLAISLGQTLSSFFNPAKYIKDNEIVCKQRHPSNPDWTVLVLRRTPLSGVWKGKVKVRNEMQPLVSPDIDETIAHSGIRSLKGNATKVFRQNLLQLDSGKMFYLSAWVSVNNPYVTTPKLADNLGITLTFKDGFGNTLSSSTLEPSGNIIEGWQQLRGSFVCPDRKAVLELNFKPGSTGNAWYDDLRLHPEQGNMKSYVYNLHDYRLQAILDEENFASYYYYDQEGNLYLVKKETVEGIKTITENISYQLEIQN